MARGAWMVVLWLLAAAPAVAEEPLPLALSWDAPAACPAAAAVHTELGRLARVRPGFALAPLRAHALITRERAGYQAQLRTEHAGHQGVRKLEARDCTTLLKTVALVLALTFGEGVELTRDERAIAPDVDSGPKQAPATDAPPPPSPQAAASEAALVHAPDTGEARTHDAPAPLKARARVPLAWRYALGVGSQLGLVGRASADVSAQLELERRALLLGLRATGSFTPKRAVAPNLDARFNAGSAALLACGVLPLGPVSGALCAAGHVGVLHGSSSGAAHGASNAPWYALSGNVALTWPRTFRLRLRAEAGLAVPLHRARFVIDGLDTVQRVARVVPEFALLLVFAP